MSLLTSLPSEILATILCNLELPTLICASYTSKRLHAVCSDAVTNPWRNPILRAIHSGVHEDLSHLSVRSVVPRHNWIEIMSLAPAPFLLYEMTVPNLRSSEWEEAYARRFLPSWRAGRREGPWKHYFMKTLYRVWHRSTTSCTAEQAWTQYLVMNKNGKANSLSTHSRGFDPLTVFAEIKRQNNLVGLPTQARLLVELADLRILVIGMHDIPHTSFYVNENARHLLHDEAEAQSTDAYSNHPILRMHDRATRATEGLIMESEGRQWVGSMMLVAQLIGPPKAAPDAIHSNHMSGTRTDAMDLVSGPATRHYTSLQWDDLWAVAPWIRERITQAMDGPTLGN